MKQDMAHRRTEQQLATWRRICSVLALVMDVL